MGDNFFTIKFDNGQLLLIDQRKLPISEDYFICKDYKDVIFAIKSMVVRGAPAIGVTAAYGIAIFVMQSDNKDLLLNNFDNVCREFAASRPTAVNLFWAIEKMKEYFYQIKDKALSQIKTLLINKAHQLYDDDINVNRNIGSFGSTIVPNGANILTHCNAGALATAGYGTALAVVRAAWSGGKGIHVYVDETRPFLQGARLTAWELIKENIPSTLICDNMAGFLMKQGKVDLVITGADRIAANGDTANKIGTYSVAVLAKENKIPFYIAAPLSTFDISISSGDGIPIEERNEKEITNVFSERIAPLGVKVYNPSFDVTPSKYIKGIITEKGIIYPPFKKNIKNLLH